MINKKQILTHSIEQNFPYSEKAEFFIFIVIMYRA